MKSLQKLRPTVNSGKTTLAYRLRFTSAMVATITTVALGAVACANIGAWAAFRLDKRAARLKRRRTPEKTLMWWAAFGPFGALVAMYRHRQRHKVAKRLFAVGVPTFAALHVAFGLAAVLWQLGAFG